MNVHESDKMRQSLSRVGFAEAEEVNCDSADIIIFNTCCVRNTAESKIQNHIAVAGKTKRPGQIFAVVGCMPQQSERGKTLAKQYRFIDIVLGTHNISRIAQAVTECIASTKRTVEILEGRTDPEDFDELQHTIDDKSNTHYVNITYGCENFCTYCIVPYVRGRLICRPSTEIFAEFKSVVSRVKQIRKDGDTHIIYLLGQNVNSYECGEQGADFAALLEGLCYLVDVDYIRVNFLSSHPRDFGDRLIRVIAENPQIERNIHLPIQSGCDRILKMMNRGYTVAGYREKVDKLRAAVPDVRITTDVICGFPTETEEEFQITVETMQSIRFNAAFIFPYSRRSGTVADKMEGHLDRRTKKARATRLIALQKKISLELAGQ